MEFEKLILICVGTWDHFQVVVFKDQRLANSTQKQLGELVCKIGIDIFPVYMLLLKIKFE